MSNSLLMIVIALHTLLFCARSAQTPEPDCTPESWPHAQYAPITRDTLARLEPVVSFACDTPVELVWSPDGMYLAISTPQAIWVHDLGSEREPLVLPPTLWPLDRSGAMRFSLDSETLALVNPTDGALQVWSLADAQLIRTTLARVEVDDQDRYSGFAAISPDLSQWALAYLDSRSIYLLDAASDEPLAVLRGHARVGALAYTPDGTRLISGGREQGSSHDSHDTTVRVWDTQTGAMLAVFNVDSPLNFPTNPPQHIAFSPDGGVAVFSVLTDAYPGASAIGLLDLTTFTFAALPIENRGVKIVTFAPDEATLAVSSYYLRQDFVTFLDFENETVLNEVQFDDNFILDIAFNPTGTLMTVAYYDTPADQVEIWAVVE